MTDNLHFLTDVDGEVQALYEFCRSKGDFAMADLSRIPAHMLAPLARYVVFGIKGGSFLTSLMSNDLQGAVKSADADNLHHLRDWCILVYNTLPIGCSGSRQKVKDWTEQGGLMGTKS